MSLVPNVETGDLSITADVETTAGGTTLELGPLINVVITDSFDLIQHRARASLKGKANLRTLDPISHYGSRTKRPNEGIHVRFGLQLNVLTLVYLRVSCSFQTSQGTLSMSGDLNWVSFYTQFVLDISPGSWMNVKVLTSGAESPLGLCCTSKNGRSRVSES